MPAQGARSESTFWGNPDDRDLVDRPLPWRGYTYDDQRRLSAVFEHAGAVDPLTAGFGSHDITNQTITSFVSQSTSSEPIAQVDWEREPNVGSLKSIQEVGVAIPRWSESGRGAGYQLGTVDLDNTTYPITHDAMGRVTTGAGGTYAYGPRGRLIEADQGGLYEGYLYDASGRLAQIINGRTRMMIHDGDQLIAAMHLDGLARWEAVHGVGIDDVLEFDRVNDQLSGHFVAVKDHRNSVVGWFNIDNSSLEQTIDYTPHGRLIVTGPDGVEHCREEGTGTDCMVQENLPPFGFAGAYRSTRTGITYMRNRWYSPKLGQFLTTDPLGYIDSFNAYAYAGMDPINFFDPYGLATTDLACQGCFDVEAEDPIGVVTAVRRGAETLDAAADDAGGFIREQLQENRKDYRRQMRECEGMECVAAHAGAFGNELAAGVLPQDGEEVKLDVVLTVTTFGLGRLFRGLVLSGSTKTASRVCSFTEGTLVLMCDGTYRPIETVQEGEWVLAQHEETGEVSCQQVVDPYANPDRSIILLELQGEDGTTEVIETTDNHPFFVADRGWTRVDELHVGDLVPSSDGSMLTVASATWTDRIETVYNFGVEGFHTYFVGESEAWVHNCNISPWELRNTHRRTLSRKEFDGLKTNIDENGVRESIKVVEFNEQLFIVDGHHRARAAKELGLETVPIEKVELPFRGYRTTQDLFY